MVNVRVSWPIISGYKSFRLVERKREGERERGISAMVEEKWVDRWMRMRSRDTQGEACMVDGSRGTKNREPEKGERSDEGMGFFGCSNQD